MSDRFWAEFWLTVVLLVIVTGLLAHSGADLAVSGHFYRAGGWPVGELFPWKLLYRIDRMPAILLAIAGLAAAVGGFYKPGMRHWIRPGLFLVLLLALGPGLVVNGIFKDHWGRPRPREVIQFGGSKVFHQPWQPGISGQGRSFPSGHSSAAFYLSAPFFVYRRRRPLVARSWLAGGLVFGLLMSYARIAQGGHFLTDCVWSLGMIWLLALLLVAIIDPDRDTPHLPTA